MRRRLSVLVALAVASGAAIAQDQPSKPKKPRLECRSEAKTGSRIAASTCHSQEEWAAIDEGAARDAGRFVNTVSTMGSRSTGLDTASMMGLAPH